jgi:FMN phosphatase YigB (HAD superfamily)
MTRFAGRSAADAIDTKVPTEVSVEAVSTILFDAGGVLADLSRDWFKRALGAALATSSVRDGLGPSFDVTACEQLMFRWYVHRREGAAIHRQEDLVEFYRQELPGLLGKAALHEQVIADLAAGVARGEIAEWRVLPEARTVIEELRRRGYVIGLLSNVTHPSRFYVEMFERWGLLELFHSTTFSSDVGFKKPSPRIFASALAKHGDPAPAECAFVGNEYETDVVGALGAGLRPVWLNVGPARPTPEPRVIEVRALVDVLRLFPGAPPRASHHT